MLIIILKIVMLPNLRIHISPVGFEVRRVTEPPIRMQADRVHLVTHKPSDNARNYYAKIR